MGTLTEGLEDLLERQKIRDCIANLARGEDRRGREWRIARRTMLYDWYQDWGTSIDWSQGVMGQPLSAEHFSGRAVGDFSATFFGKP